ncbi:MAG TPA: DivIVA domain-containing protein, partial [Gaiellaceae bacterium]|nr:DivIVA domain-containing protein [Gaiellaceae bacterium]
AERASHDMKEQARKEAELIVAEAHTESRSVTRDAASKKERLEGDLRRVQALLRSALAATEEWPGGKAPDEEDTDGGIRRIAG